MAKAEWTEAGELLLAAETVRNIREKCTRAPRLTWLDDSLLLSPQQQPGQRRHPLLYGDLQLFSVAELLALLTSLRASGLLTLLLPHARKSITFLNGRVVYASSSVEDDRLGEVLWRRGMLSLEQLSEVYDLVGPGKKLGAVLLERGLINARQLYEGIQAQVMEIVYSTFFFDQGEFVFIEGLVRQPSSVRLDVSTRELIAAGLRGRREHNRLERFQPDGDEVLVRRQVDLPGELERRQVDILNLVDGQRTTAEIISASGLGEKSALEVLADLHRQGLVEPAAAVPPSSGKMLGLAFERYRSLLQVIYMALQAASPAHLERLESFLGQPPPPYSELFRSVGFSSAGRLDVDTLYRNARSQEPQGGARKRALDALQYFYDYARFQAMDVLDDDTCDTMMDRLQAIEEDREDT